MPTTATLHQEQTLEAHLVDQLVTTQGYRQRQPTDYDRALALDPDLLLEFIQTTQPAEWDKLTRQYGAQTASEFLKRVADTLAKQGTLGVLRGTVDFVPGIKFRLCSFAPASGLNPDLVTKYEANILSVIRQVAYSQKTTHELDLVLFVNGLPVATLELKNNLTKSTINDAERQYRQDRSPAGEPLLTFKRGALVHFALDEDLVSMTTRLQNGKTTFLPFNRGRDGGAGNPDIPGDFRIAYLYRDLPGRPAIFGRATWLAILQHFLHLAGKGEPGERLIFPRYQQLDAVQRLMTHARAHGAGHNYLIQHSAGSGKSNTIAWAAHQIINLHDDQDRARFDAAIIVTDRLVLDKQLQSTVGQFEQTPGLVKPIDGSSSQLKAAIAGGARIIVTTIQKLGTDQLATLTGQSGRRFAIIVDEAHGSQSGKTAQALAGALTREQQEAEAETLEQRILAHQASHGPQPTISYLAFTATPRNVTLERFGTPVPGGAPLPFHLYSMRQAIEEGFILDVLSHYETYRAYYELEKAIADDPKFETSQGRRQVARFAHLHPIAVEQKAEVIVEHFQCHVRPELDGQAKGMVVTGSRESALRLYFGLKEYIKAQGYADLKPLVAFSGELTLDGQTYTEASLNEFGESQLPARFDANPAYRLLVVAEKYQTGFDQPKLCAMYIDRKLAGLQAVQTLSRLNRTYPGKQRLYILDFQNTVEEIQDAFRPYYETTTLASRTDLNQIYDLAHRLRDASILDPRDLAAFAATYFKPTLVEYDRIRLQSLLQPALRRFQDLADDAAREEFRQLLRSFLRFYAFVAQIVPLADPDLEQLAVYGEWLARVLPDRARPADLAITDDMLRLHAFTLQQQEAGSAALAPGDTVALHAIRDFAARPYAADEEESLSTLIKSFNERYGTDFTRDQIISLEAAGTDVMTADMIAMLQNNAPDVVFPAFREALFRQFVLRFQSDHELRQLILTEPAARDDITRHLFDRARHAVAGA